jgi:serine/threonine protein phosphatase 1
MKSTWIVGDIHGCAKELGTLIDKLELQADDRFISVGDLYHRGPDPVGVAELMLALPQFELVLGNHERVLVERLNRLPAEVDLSGFDAHDLAGDGGTTMAEFNPADSDKLLSLVRGRPYFIRGEHEGQGWLIVHAGVIPGKSVEDSTPFELTRVRELSNMPGNPFWGEVWAGPELVIYGHTVFRFMRTHFVGEKLVSLGLDTGCVYGGTLTAYRIEDGSVVEVAAERSYWPLR